MSHLCDVLHSHSFPPFRIHARALWNCLLSPFLFCVPVRHCTFYDAVTSQPLWWWAFTKQWIAGVLQSPTTKFVYREYITLTSNVIQVCEYYMEINRGHLFKVLGIWNTMALVCDKDTTIVSCMMYIYIYIYVCVCRHIHNRSKGEYIVVILFWHFTI